MDFGHFAVIHCNESLVKLVMKLNILRCMCLLVFWRQVISMLAFGGKTFKC